MARVSSAFAPVLAMTLAFSSLPTSSPIADPAPFRVPVPVVRTLPNGLRVAIFRDSRFPLVQMQLLVPAGVAQEGLRTPGTANATSQLLRAGTSSRPAGAFAMDVDRLGGAIHGVAAREFSTLNGTFLSEDFEAGVELFADAVVNPIFPAEEVDRFRFQAGRMLAQALQDPAALAEDWLWALAFEGHPYGRRTLGTLESLSRLDRQDVREFYRDFYRPDRAVLVIAGDVDPEHAFATAADRFGSWAGRAVETPRVPVPPAPATPRVRIVDQPGRTRSEVRIGFLAPPRRDADAVPLLLANYILGGGGFSSRLTRALRVEGGLSYDVRSNYTTLRDAGLLTLATSARDDSVAVVLEHVRREIARLAEQPPDEAEVAAARHFFENSYPLEFQTLGALIAQWTAADFQGLPAGALGRSVEEVGAVTAEQVAGVVRRWLDPAHMVVVVVGPAAVLQGRLEALGPVQVVTDEDLAPSARQPEPEPASPEESRRGREVLEQALAAHGGLDRLRRVEDSIVNGNLTLQLAGNDVTVSTEQVRKDPYRMKYVTHVASVENGQILNDTRGWVYAIEGDQQQVSDVDDAGVEALRAVFRSDVVHVLLAAADSSSSVVWRGRTQAEGRDVDVLEVTLAAGVSGAGSERRRLYFDATDHLLIAEDTGESPAAPGTYQVRRIYRDHQAVEGVLWPFYEERQREGVRTMILVVSSVAINTGVPDAVFQEPGQGRPDRPLR